MDFNGLADPYVKLHLLPGACKVLFGCNPRLYASVFMPAALERISDVTARFFSALDFTGQ